MKEQKKYHQRKLAIIEMIENCKIAIKNQRKFIQSMPSGFALKNTYDNISRLHVIHNYLLERYNRD